jgi:hypothetical protein
MNPQDPAWPHWNDTDQYDHWQFQQKGMSPALLDFLSRASIVLLAKARDLVADQGADHEDNWRLGVILAHAACDIQTDKALNDLIERRSVHYLRDILPGTDSGSLKDGRIKKLWAALSGDSPWTDGPLQAAWWQPWAASVERRNGIAHRGEKVNHQDAVASVNACEQHVLYLMNKAS